MQVSRVIINYFANFTEVIAIFFILNTIFRRKNISIVTVSGIILAITSIGCASDYLISNDLLRIIFCITLNFIGMLYLFKARFSEMMLLMLSGTVFVVFFAEVICLLIAGVTLSNRFELLLAYDGFRILLIVCKSIMTCILYFLFKSYIVTYQSLIFKRTKAFLLLITSNLLIIVITSNALKNSFRWSDSEKVLVLLLFFELLFTILIVVLISRTVVFVKNENDWVLVRRAYEKQNAYYDQLQSLICELKQQRHDFNNHLNCMIGLLALKDYDELNQYLCSITDRVDVLNTMIDCGSPVLTALISEKYEEAIKSEIVFNTSVQIREEINVNPIDLSIIIGNALDNAIEACQKVVQNVKEINFKLETKSNYVFIEIENTCNNVLHYDQEGLVTTKEDVDNHGYGLKNIKFTVERYDGVMNITKKNDCFILEISMLNEPLDAISA